MIFHSLPFLIFFPVFFCCYWFIFNRNLKLQNLLILAGSYFFYAWWNPLYLVLLIAFSLFNYIVGNFIYKATEKNKLILTRFATLVALGLLFYYKYTNFFIGSFITAFEHFNIHLNITTLKIVLPLGISFYIFRTLSYLYDIKNGKMRPVDDWVVFFSFVAFFPCLLSGPIDRARNLIPQLQQKRTFTTALGTDGLRQILWGLFKKVVIADSMAPYVDKVFIRYGHSSGVTLVLGACYYTIQLYCDFSGYSDMAIGIAKLLGFEVAKNFSYPLFSQNVAEFWRRWHISLSTWVTEYVFTPLTIFFRDYRKAGLIISIVISFTLIGIWHGANWTFACFGLLHGLYFIPLIIKGSFNKKIKTDPTRSIPSFSEFFRMLLTFLQISFSFIIFRSENLSAAFQYIRRISSPVLLSYRHETNLIFIPVIVALLVIEWIQRNKEYALQIGNIKYGFVRWSVYIVLLVTILFSWTFDATTGFTYVKF